MKFGVFLDSAIPPGTSTSRRQVLKEVFDLVEYCEALGLDGVWFAEHHFTPEVYDPVPLTMSALAVARTSRMVVGTSVVLLPLHHPLHVIEQAALLDQVSGGRFHLGMGLGFRPGEFEAFGVSRRVRGQRMEEGLQIITRYLEGRPFSFDGTHFQLEDVRPVLLPIDPGRFRLWVGARGPVPSRRAGRYGCSLILGTSQVSYDDYVSSLVESGHDPRTRSLAVLRTVHVARSYDEAWARCGDAVLFESRVAREWYRGAADLPGDVRPPYESVGDRRKVAKFIGSPDDVSRDIADVARRYQGPVGLEWIIMNPRPGCLGLGVTRESLAMLAKEVLPRFRK